MSGIRTSTMKKAINVSGGLMKKTARHERESQRMPPRRGPPTVATAAARLL